MADFQAVTAFAGLTAYIGEKRRKLGAGGRCVLCRMFS